MGTLPSSVSSSSLTRFINDEDDFMRKFVGVLRGRRTLEGAIGDEDDSLGFNEVTWASKDGCKVIGLVVLRKLSSFLDPWILSTWVDNR